MNEEQIPLIQILDVLANEQRMEILRKLKSPRDSFPPQDEGDPELDGVCVSSIQAGQGLAFSTTSKYLTDLARVGLVTVKRSGKWSYYKRNEKTIRAVVARLKSEL
jgi:DNA-binding transcriptional ArsR family regulator